MSPGIVWIAGFGNDKFGINEGIDSKAVDAAAFFMLGLVVVIIALVAAFAVSMARRARRPDQTLKFLNELDDGGNAMKPGAPPTAGPQWQKPDDWWTK
jgi:hypothetical protein